MLTKYFGDWAFVRRCLVVALPIIIQNGISNFVSLLDNIMVGQVGTMPMSGVSIVNGLVFVFNLCIFGASAGAGIFTAQFHGSQDQEGIRYTFRFKIFSCLVIALAGIGIFLSLGTPLINLYLTGKGDAQLAAGALHYGLGYLKVMLWGFLPFALCNAYSSTLRETGKTLVPMVAGVAAVLVNLVLNYVLIFGHLGLPALGVQGAAIATVISRYVELAIVAGWTHLKPEQNPYIRGVYRSPHIPASLLKNIFCKGMPLLLNEFFWASGIAVLHQCYSTCGLDVVPAMNIASTLYDLGSVVSLSMGTTVGIIIGQMMGAGIPKREVRESSRKLMTLAVTLGSTFGLLMALFSGVFPELYKTDPAVRQLAAALICINAAVMPFCSYSHSTYFTLRAGGQTFVTFLFDSCFAWVVCIPLAFILSRYTDMDILAIFTIVQATELLKCLLGAYMLKQGKWIQNLTAQ